MWNIQKLPSGKWSYVFVNTAYGSAAGKADSLEEAKVRLAIAQADVMEQPFPQAVVDEMLADPVKYAADYPDPK